MIHCIIPQINVWVTVHIDEIGLQKNRMKFKPSERMLVEKDSTGVYQVVTGRGKPTSGLSKIVM